MVNFKLWNFQGNMLWNFRIIKSSQTYCDNRIKNLKIAEYKKKMAGMFPVQGV